MCLHIFPSKRYKPHHSVIKGEYMRRVNTRGMKQSNKCMLMAAIAYNLKKLMKFTARKVQADVKALQQSLQNAFLMFYILLAPIELSIIICCKKIKNQF